MVVIVMGVSGSGKTTVGRLLAERCGWRFHDADGDHPESNVRKMASGKPLTEADREPWLKRIRQRIEQWLDEGESVVLACSALSERSRHLLAQGDARVRFVHLRGDFELIEARLRERDGHFMPAKLLRSQFEALEPPRRAIIVDVNDAPAALAQRIDDALSAA